MNATQEIAGSTRADFTGIGQRGFRNRLRSALDEIESEVAESESFWESFSGETTQNHSNTLVFVDLSNLVTRFKQLQVHGWTASVRRNQPFFVAFVRTKRDRTCVGLIDDVLRASDMRVNVCDDASNWTTVIQCLSAGVSSVRPEGLLEVRYLAAQRGLWAHFGDGLAGLLTWNALGIEDLEGTLVPESSTVNDTHTAIEIATCDGGLFEIDSASARAVLDHRFAEDLAEAALGYDASVSAAVRRTREAAGLTQTALGDASGLDQAVISRIERGKVRPRVDTLKRLADGMGVSLSTLLST